MNRNQLRAIAFFVAFLLAAGFWYYMRSTAPEREEVFCTLEALQCPDGSYVGRTGPNCEFAACPSGGEDPKPVAGQFCGGIAGIQCGEGFTCELEGDYPDAGGSCVKK